MRLVAVSSVLRELREADTGPVDGKNVAETDDRRELLRRRTHDATEPFLESVQADAECVRERRDPKRAAPSMNRAYGCVNDRFRRRRPQPLSQEALDNGDAHRRTVRGGEPILDALNGVARRQLVERHRGSMDFVQGRREEASGAQFAKENEDDAATVRCVHRASHRCETAHRCLRKAEPSWTVDELGCTAEAQSHHHADLWQKQLCVRVIDLRMHEDANQWCEIRGGRQNPDSHHPITTHGGVQTLNLSKPLEQSDSRLGGGSASRRQ